MTKEEAIKEMQKGKKITHTYFSNDEWMTMNSKGYLLLEDGVECSLLEFFKWRPGESWDNGCSVWNVK